VSTRTLPVIVVFLAMAACPQLSPADILNGDFESAVDLAHWTKVALAAPDPSYAVVDEVTDLGNDELYLMAHNTYTWSGTSWVLNEFIGSIAQASNPADYNLYAPTGTTKLSFDAKVDILSVPGDAAPRLRVEVQYNFSGGVFGATANLALGDADWANHSINLPGLDLAKKMNLNVYARSGDGIAAPAGQYVGQTTNLIAEGWFDNFRFVPDPVSAAMLVLGGAAIVMRRRSSRR